MSQRKLLPSEIQFLRDALSADCRVANIRLREGEHQYTLVKAIASFQLELWFPDVKDIIRRLYGDKTASDLQFIRKIQTILKKMEKSDIVRILPKKKPWELQRYALSSFKFQDSDRNLVSLVTEQQMKETQDLLRSMSNRQGVMRMNYAKLCLLTFIVVVSYTAILWSLLQPVASLLVFVPALCVSSLCSLLLGRVLSRG